MHTGGFRSDAYKVVENHTLDLDLENRGAKKRDRALDDLVTTPQSKRPQCKPAVAGPRAES